MVKATSPVRLKSSLMSAATAAGIPLQRTAAEQIEYWADIGRKVAKTVDPETLLAVQAGLAVLRVDHAESSSVDPDAVFKIHDEERKSGALSEAIASGSVRYQASLSKPGSLEACYPDGHIEVGQFTDGLFIAE